MSLKSSNYRIQVGIVVCGLCKGVDLYIQFSVIGCNTHYEQNLKQFRGNTNHLYTEYLEVGSLPKIGLSIYSSYILETQIAKLQQECD